MPKQPKSTIPFIGDIIKNIQRLIPIVGVRPYSLDELMLLASVAVYFKPTYIVEWGNSYRQVGKDLDK